jgi:ATP-dependent DNA helicase 2 subunit 1
VFDSLIKVMATKELMAIVKFIPKKGSQLRICALLPQKESYDEDHFQTPPGFNLIFLPYSEDIVNFTGDKTTAQPADISKELAHMCKLLINNLTINDFDVRNFDSPSLQKFYAHLQAHALGEKEVDEPADLLKQDEDAMLKCLDIIQMIKDTLQLEISGDIEKGNYDNKKGNYSESD